MRKSRYILLALTASSVFVFTALASSDLQRSVEQVPPEANGGKLSLCGSYEAFLRKSTNVATLFAMETEDLLSDQIWLLNRKTREEILLVEDQAPQTESVSDDMRNLIQLIDEKSLTFSGDGKKLYFLAHAWATSAALHVVDIESKTRTFLLPANQLISVLRSGDYADHIIVQQHRYFLGGGSYDWYWLFTPDGREVGPIADSEDGVNYFMTLQKERHDELIRTNSGKEP
jgi:hypothetical protein